MSDQATEAFGLKLQHLGTDSDRTLVLGHAIGLRNGNDRFTTGEIAEMFDDLHVPPPANISARLGNLRSKNLVVRNKDASWGVTPIGKVAAVDLIGSVDLASLEVDLVDVPSAELGNVSHAVIAPTYAPQKWMEPIARLLAESPFERNVFLMTRFPDEDNSDDPVNVLIPRIAGAVEAHGLNLYVADDRQLDDDLLSNVAAYMWACQYGIGLIEDRVGRDLNYNVVTELGAMLVTGRRCAIIRDSVTAPAMPTDLVGQIYKSVDFDDGEAVSRAVHSWLALDLGLGACSDCS